MFQHTQLIGSLLTFTLQIGKTGNTPSADGPICGSDEFNWGMYKDRDANGQDDFDKWMEEFKNPGDPFAPRPPDNRKYDGVLLVTGHCKDIVANKLEEIQKTLGNTIQKVLQIDGHARPDKNRGREQ